MTVKLAIEITSPLTADDHDLLTGISVLTLAIANREMAENRFPETFQPDEEQEPPPEDDVAGQARPCGDLEYTVLLGSQVAEPTGGICISPVGHRGRHRYRPVTRVAGGIN